MHKIYPHHAHLLQRYVKGGERVERGQVIGLVGKSGTKVPHLHFEARLDLFGGVNYYPRYRSKNWIRQHYMDPLEYMSQFGIVTPMNYTHFGYRFLDRVSWNLYHPGVDFNRGAPYDDLGDPTFATASGIVVYSDYDGGWGEHIVIENDTAKPLIERVNQALRECGEDPARSVGTLNLSKWWQNRVARGEIDNYADLINKIKWHQQNKRYPHD